MITRAAVLRVTLDKNALDHAVISRAGQLAERALRHASAVVAELPLSTLDLAAAARLGIVASVCTELRGRAPGQRGRTAWVGLGHVREQSRAGASCCQERAQNRQCPSGYIQAHRTSCKPRHTHIPYLHLCVGPSELDSTPFHSLPLSRSLSLPQGPGIRAMDALRREAPVRPSASALRHVCQPLQPPSLPRRRRPYRA